MSNTTPLDLKPNELQALEKMRTHFLGKPSPTMVLDDKTFLRYLRARNFNFDKASHLLEGTLKWRIDFGMETFQEDWKAIIAQENATGKTYARSFDKEGHAIVYMTPARENTHDHDGNIKHLVYNIERAITAMEAITGQQKICLVIDYNDYSLANAPPMKTARETLTILQDHYPERLHRAYCIKPPFLFYAFYRVISPFIDPITKKKICMLTDSEMKKSENQLYTELGREVLEARFGGEDARPFVSEIYLNSPFNVDLKTALDQSLGAAKGTSDELELQPGIKA